MTTSRDLKKLSVMELAILGKVIQNQDRNLEIMIKDEFKRRDCLHCDMCHTAILDKKTMVRIKKFEWSLCHACWQKFHPSITFLAIGVGMDIDFEVLK